MVVLRAEDPSPFAPQSDEEPEEKEDANDAGGGDENGEDDAKKDEAVEVRIDFADVARRTLALPMPPAAYAATLPGPDG